MEKKRVYLLVCISYNEITQEDNEFILGAYSTQQKANIEKDEVEKQAQEQNQDLQYRVDEYIVID